MIYTKTNPVGIDVPIQRMQQYLYDNIVSDYDCDVNAYGRVLVDNDKGSIKPIAFLGNTEYIEVLTDDKIKGLHFFFVENEESNVLKGSCLSSNDVDIIFIVNDIVKLKGSIEHYADEEIKDDALRYVSKFFNIDSVTKGEKALEGFDVSQLSFMFPYYVFKIKVEINNY